MRDFQALAMPVGQINLSAGQNAMQGGLRDAGLARDFRLTQSGV